MRDRLAALGDAALALLLSLMAIDLKLPRRERGPREGQPGPEIAEDEHARATPER